MSTRKTVTLVLVVQVTTLITVVVLLGFVPGVTRLVVADSVRHFSLLAETMQPIDSSIVYDNTMAYLKTVQDSTVSLETSYIGQLDLPDGASIVNVQCFGLDTDSSEEFYFRLYRYNLYDDPVWSPVTDFAFSGVAFSAGKVEVNAPVDPANAVVDNAQYSYGIFLALPAATSGQLGVLRCVVDTTSGAVHLPSVQRNWPSP
jgi:hypothetical protein